MVFSVEYVTTAILMAHRLKKHDFLDQMTSCYKLLPDLAGVVLDPLRFTPACLPPVR
jgi:hypothetical protein